MSARRRKPAAAISCKGVSPEVVVVKRPTCGEHVAVTERGKTLTKSAPDGTVHDLVRARAPLVRARRRPVNDCGCECENDRENHCDCDVSIDLPPKARIVNSASISQNFDVCRFAIAKKRMPSFKEDEP
jgi:hypothetical protein